MTHIVLPELGEGITKATVAVWHAAAGQKVQAGDELVEVVTDKAVFNIEAPASGTITSIAVEQGKEAAIGQVLGVIG